jgi:hypothetical protein
MHAALQHTIFTKMKSLFRRQRSQNEHLSAQKGSKLTIDLSFRGHADTSIFNDSKLDWCLLDMIKEQIDQK